MFQVQKNKNLYPISKIANYGIPKYVTMVDNSGIINMDLLVYHNHYIVCHTVYCMEVKT